MPSYYLEWTEKVHYHAGPVLETGDLQQSPSLQEGELMLVLVPDHHASPVLAEAHDEAGPVEANDRDEDNPVLETGDLQ